MTREETEHYTCRGLAGGIRPEIMPCSMVASSYSDLLSEISALEKERVSYLLKRVMLSLCPSTT
jgi:hypothetical protein